MKLRDILEQMEQGLPDGWDKWDDIRPNSVYKVNLCFMCEKETWVQAYPEHPILIPFYACEVSGIYPEGENTLRIWLKYESYMPKLLKALEHIEAEEE